MMKLQKLPENLNSSHWAQIKLETGSEMLILCCRNSISTKQRLVEVSRELFLVALGLS